MHLYAFRGFDEEGSTRVIKYYDPSEVDARIQELEKALREMLEAYEPLDHFGRKADWDNATNDEWDEFCERAVAEAKRVL